MVKSFIKEFIIILVLLLAIVLVLGIFLYDYIPTSKVIPKVEAYEAPNSIKQELQEAIEDSEKDTTQIVYEIDGTDLKNYEKSKDYQKGKVNPFSQTTSEDNPTNNKPSGTNNNSNANNGTNNNSNSVGNYLPNTGTK